MTINRREFIKANAIAAAAAVAVGDTLGIKVSEIAAQLEDKGYTIREIDVSRSKIEVEVTFDGADYEIDVDRTSGTVIKMMTGSMALS